MRPTTLTGARIFDGTDLLDGQALMIENGQIAALIPEDAAGPDAIRLAGGIIAPGLVDLQINGGGGLMVGTDTDADGLAHILAAQAGIGTLGCLPTLITDTPHTTARVIEAGIAAARRNMAGFLGLHLEGPHLDPRRAGAHDPALIRPMGADDLALLCRAAQQLPALMVTVAPENTTPEQIATLKAAGAIVSLGHSDCDFDTARQAFAAGAGCATHLFNAMGPFAHRAPSLSGAVLAGDMAAGLIADGIHIHPAALSVALAARPSGLFLVSDCMAFAGTDLAEMTLHGRPVRRENGRLVLGDGTLAGADLSLVQAVRFLVQDLGISPGRSLAMATSVPAKLVGADGYFGHIAPGRRADLVWLTADWQLGRIWQNGRPLTPQS